MHLALCLNEIEQEQRKLSRSAIFAHLYGPIAPIAAPIAHLFGMEWAAAED